jgi:hypothetical protein
MLSHRYEDDHASDLALGIVDILEFQEHLEIPGFFQEHQEQ